ncbi:MAG: hypothetical protein GXO79_14130 [Chlorobi bacterium]|nr:hypothetical protein [Chlorobiota bacterium]
MIRISSRLTYFFKLGWILIAIILLPIPVFFLKNSEIGFFIKIQPLLFYILFIGITFFTKSLKHVFKEGDHLIVKGFRKKIKIEKWEIQKVEQNILFFAPRIMTIHLKWKSNFGFKIRFMPYKGWAIYWPHPLVDEMNNWIEK